MEFKLLRRVPQIEDAGQILSISGMSLDLLLYISHQKQDIYRRDRLIEDLWGGYNEPNQRKLSNALNQLQKEIKKLIKAESNVIYFKHESVEVDTINFLQKAQLAMYQSGQKDYRTLNTIQAALKVYQAHFLESYFPQIEGLVDWREKEQLNLAHTRHSLFERIVCTHIQYGNLSEAKSYAQQWLASLEPGYVPLQYLIWITGNYSAGTNTELDMYLAQLEAYEQEDELRMGPTSEEWRYYLREHPTLPPWLLRMHDEKIAEPIVVSSHPNMVSRQSLINHLLQSLFASTGRRILGLTGLPGVGKTTIANQIARAVFEAPGMPKLIRLELRSDSSFPHVLDEIIKDLGDLYLLKLDFATKKTRSQYLLQSERHIIIVDDYDGEISKNPMLDELLGYIGQTPLLLATKSLRDSRFQVIEVQGFGEEGVQQLLSIHHIDNASYAQVRELAQLLGGLPLLLNIVLSFVHWRRIRDISQALEEARGIVGPVFRPENTDEIYRQILSRFQYHISPDLRHLLQLIALFDPLAGVKLSNLLHSQSLHFSQDEWASKLSSLAALALIHPLESSDEPSYRVHATLRRFLLPANLEDNPSQRLQDFVAIIVAYIQEYQADYAMLDRLQGNIVQALILLEQNFEDYLSVTDYIQLLISIYVYIENRGFFELGTALLLKAIQAVTPDTPASILLDLYHMLGQIYSRQRRQEDAQLYLEKALQIAEDIDHTDRFATIYLDIGLIDLHFQRWDKAKQGFWSVQELAISKQDVLLESQALINLGTCAFRQGDYAEAERYYQVILQKIAPLAADSPQHRHLYFMTLNALGASLENRLQFDQAQHYYELALEMIPDVNDPVRIANLFLNVGVLHYRRKEFDAAYENFLAGKQIIDATGQSEGRALFYLNLGLIALQRHNYSEGERQLKLGLIQTRDHKIDWLESMLLLALGKLYLHQAKFQLAANNFLRALQQAVERPNIKAEALYGLVLNHMLPDFIVGTGQIEDARYALSEIIKQYQFSKANFIKLSQQNLADAHDVFSHDLADIPNLERYCIVEAIIEWLSID